MNGGCSARIALFLHLRVVADHLVDDEAQEFFGEFRIKIGLRRQLAQPRDLAILAPRIGGRKPGLGLVPAHRLRDLEPFGEQEDECRNPKDEK